jgi:hypothetical protein
MPVAVRSRDGIPVSPGREEGDTRTRAHGHAHTSGWRQPSRGPVRTAWSGSRPTPAARDDHDAGASGRVSIRCEDRHGAVSGRAHPGATWSERSAVR